MASSADQMIMGLLKTAGLGSTPNSVAADNVAIQGGQLQNQQARMVISAAQQKAQDEQSYATDLNAYYAHPSTQALARLAARYPDHAEALKQSYSMMDADKRTSDQTTFGGLFNAAASGRADLAIQLLQQRKAAEQAAGHDTTELDDQLGRLQSADPAARSAALKQLQGFAQIHLAAADPSKFADVFGTLGKGSEGFTLGQGQSRFDGNGNPIASVAAKPDYLVVPEGGMAVPINGAPALSTGGGGQASGVTGAGPSAPVAHLTGGQIEQLATNAVPGIRVTSRDRTFAQQADLYRKYLAYKSGKGPWAPLAAKPGTSPHEDDRGRDFTPPEGMSLPQLASQLHAAMPGAHILNEGNHIHVDTPMLARGQAPVAQQQGSGPPGTIYGRPKPGYQVLRPDEVPAGLDPNTIYQRGPDGQISPVGGQRQGQLKPIPQQAATGIIENRATLGRVDQALSLLDHHKDAVGMGTGILGERYLNWHDPSGVETRAAIGEIAGRIIHDVSGAAVTEAEAPRFKPYVPALTDSYETARQKLLKLRQNLAAKLDEQTGYYTEDNGYRPFGTRAGGGGGNSGPPPAAIQMLRAKPQLRGAFDAKYGKGSAAQALGR